MEFAIDVGDGSLPDKQKEALIARLKTISDGRPLNRLIAKQNPDEERLQEFFGKVRVYTDKGELPPDLSALYRQTVK